MAVITLRRLCPVRPALLGLALLAGLAGTAALGFWQERPVVSTIALGQPIGSNAMVVDRRTHRAFIATMTTGAAAPPISRVNVLDTRTGRLLPPVVVGVNLLPLALDARQEHVVVASSTLTGAGIVRLLDSRTGAIVRSTVLSAPPEAVAVDAQAGHIFVAGGQMSICLGITCRATPTIMRVLDAGTLRVLRTVPLGQLLGDMMVDERRGRIFVPTSDGIEVLDAISGRVGSLVPGRAVVALDARTGHVLTRTGAGLAMLDVPTGRVLWTRRELTTNVTVDARTGNVLIIPVTSDVVEVVQGVSGRTLHTVRVGALPVSIALDTQARRAYVANHGDHTVSVLDLRRWRVLRSIPVGPYPIMVVVDEGAGRAIVENTSAYVSQQQGAWAWMPPQVRRWLPFLPALLVRSAPTIPAVPTSGSVSVLDAARI